jgi:hypothetical protein
LKAANKDPASRGGGNLMWAIGLATLVVTPYAYSLFQTVGGPFDEVFATNFYHLPFEARFNPFSLLVAQVVTTLAAVAGVHYTSRGLRSSFPIARLVISILAFLFALNFLRSGVLFALPLSQILSLLREYTLVSAGVAIVAIVGGLALLVRFRSIFDRVLKKFFQAYALVGIVIAFNGVAAIAVLWPHLSFDFEVSETRPNVEGESTAARQFVWMIFDQADQGLIYERRHASLELPNFDNLKQKSFFATNAFSPGSPTFVAIPALFTGDVHNVTKGTPDTPYIALDSGELAFSQASTVFSDARERGIETSMIVQTFDVGALCRVMVSSIERCWQENAFRGHATAPIGYITGQVVAVWRRFLYAVPLVRLAFPRISDGLTAIGVIEPSYVGATLDATLAVVREELIRPLTRDRLLYVHWMLPHQPFIYDHIANERVGPRSVSDEEGYRGNLELADQILGEVLKTIETRAAPTALLVTADHGFDGLHVPFLIKLPDLDQDLEFEAPVDTGVTRALISSFFEGDVRTQRSLESFLTRNSLDKKE